LDQHLSVVRACVKALQLFLQLEPEALDITDSESQHSDQQDDKTTKTDEEKTEITTPSNFAQSSKKFTFE
jgi:hypothetical protein